MYFLKTLFYYLKILGLAPVSLSLSQNKTLFKISNPDFIFNIFLLSGTVILFGYLNLFYESKPSSRSEYLRRYTTAYLNRFALSISFLAIIGTYAKFLTGQNEIVRLGNKIFDLFKIVRDVGEAQDNWNISLRAKLIAGVILSTHLSIWIIDIFGFAGPIFEISCIYITNFIISCLIVQFAIVIVILQGLITMINSKFESLTNHCTHDPQKLNISSQIRKFMILKDLCFQFHGTATEICEFYSLPLLGCISNIFCLITIDLYYIVRPIVFGNKTTVFANDVANSLWLYMEIFCLVIITYHVTKTSKEVMHLIVYINARKIFGIVFFIGQSNGTDCT